MFSPFDNTNESGTLVLPKSSLGYHTNNVYPAFPPLMSDSRSIISSWQSESSANNNLIRSNNIKSNWMYRKYLQTNAVEIMKANYIESANDTGYVLPGKGQIQPEGTPFALVSMDSLEKVSDLKTTYLTRDQLTASKNVYRDTFGGM